MAKGKTAHAKEAAVSKPVVLRGILNTSNLPALQNLVKRDPAAYEDEFRQQWNYYKSLRMIYAASVGADLTGNISTSSAVLVGNQGLRLGKEQEDRFRELLAFVTQLVPCYPQITQGFFEDLSDLILKHYSSLSPDSRHSAVRSLILLRNKDVIGSEELLRVLFPLLSIATSSVIRSLIQATVLSDIKNANQKSVNHRLNRIVQGLLFGVVSDGIDAQVYVDKGKREAKSRSQALWAVRLAADLWRKNIWNDPKTVSLLATACFHPDPKVQSSAIRFFLNDLHHAEDGAESEEDSDDEPVVPDVSKLKHQRKINKKSRSGDKKIRAAAALAKKRNKQKAARAEEGSANFAALYLLHDPQTFGEKLFQNLKQGDKRHPLEVKIRLMQLLSRVMGAHKLCVLDFYSYIVKYLAPKQMHITLILVSLAQSVHEQTPPDELTPVIRKIADGFVHPGVGAEAVAAGINSIREICRRQPWCMEESLLSDLIFYRSSKDKGVSAASRGLLTLYREVNPSMLARKDRGKSGSMAIQGGTQPRAYGTSAADTQVDIAGLDLLAQHLEEEKARKAEAGEDGEGQGDEDEGWKDWELESDSDDDSDSSGGWINVDSEGESDFDVEYSDSEDENGEKKPKDGDQQSAKRSLAERREAKKLERQKARLRAERKAQGLDTEESSEGEGSDAGADSGSESDDEGEGSSLKPGAATSSEAATAATDEVSKLTELATTRILTPADFAKLNELRLAAVESAIATGGRTGANAKRELAALQEARKRHLASGAREDDLAFLDEADILGPRKKAKADYEARLASIAKGREDREKFGSKKGKKMKDKKSSSTNEQKSKGKNFGMVSKSWAVRKKNKASLRDKSKALKKHKEKQAKSKGMKH